MNLKLEIVGSADEAPASINIEDRTDRTESRRWITVGMLNGLLLAYLLIHPAHLIPANVVSNVGGCIGPIVGAFWCLREWFRARTRPGTELARRVTVCLGLAALSYGIGQSIWTFYENILGHECPFPSIADLFFFAAYPLLFMGVLQIPTTTLTPSAWARVVLDSCVLLTVFITFSWYFLLGPNIIESASSSLAKFLSAAYPVFDLVLLCCLTLLGNRRDANSRWLTVWVSVSLLPIVFSDSIFGYETLKKVYHTGNWTDVGWSLGYMTLGCGAAQFLRKYQSNTEEMPTAEEDRSPVLWRSLFPYAFVPAIASLYWYTSRLPESSVLNSGVRVGAGVLIVLILARQVLAMIENASLYRFLNEAYGDLDDARKSLEMRNLALEEANLRLENLAFTDGLTGIRNHRAFQDELLTQCQVAEKQGSYLSVILLDADYFKQFNDSYGHPAGDDVLRRIALLLTESSRGGDCVARYGGEEFAIILPDALANAAEAAAERFRNVLVQQEWEFCAVTASFGVATSIGRSCDPSELVRQADLALYASKADGRNRVTHFEKINGLKTA